MEVFVAHNSIVKKIWGKADTILFVFAGASAEFAVNKAVDWLYFTGRLPSDPLGRLFSTVAYARQIIFSELQEALQSIDKIAQIHKAVEQQRESKIPDWAYRDVLFMLIDYSIRAYELLERKLTEGEKEEVFDVFYRVGERMQIPGLPGTFSEWILQREKHMREDLAFSAFTKDLYKQYRKHLGVVRYQILRQAQVLVVPHTVNKLLNLGKLPLFAPVVYIYKLCRILKVDALVKSAILPKAYKTQIDGLDAYGRK